METRKIMIANTKTNQRYTIETNATTLGELQDILTEKGIDFEGMDFTEGISKTHLLRRDSLLPTNVMYKGQPTNNLVMLLTNTSKKIESGVERTRANAYAIIKSHGKEYTNGIILAYGRPYTNVATADLWNYIDEKDEEVCATPYEVQHPAPHAPETNNSIWVNFIYDNIKMLTLSGSLTADDVEALSELVAELAKRTKENETVNITNRDIDEMIAAMK